MDIMPTEDSAEWKKFKDMDPLLMMQYEPLTAEEARVMIKKLGGRWVETDIYAPDFRFKVADKIKDLENKVIGFENK